MLEKGQAEGDGTEKVRKVGIGCAVVLGLLVLIGMCNSPPDGNVEAPDSATKSASNELNDADQAAVSRWIDAVLTQSAGCDSQMAALGEAMQAAGEGRGNVYDGYTAATAARRSCEAAWLGYRDIAVPEALSDLEDRFEAANEQCRIAAFSKREAAGKAMELFDGDMRPSVVSGIRDDLAAASRDGLGCAAKVASIASETGVDLEAALGNETTERPSNLSEQ